ncbi:MAG: DUF488 domain-containing protein [Candidatus Micrarchaeaceae archaeon]
MKRLFTVGYSTMSVKDLLETLKNNNVNLLVDIRTIPKSRSRSEFNKGRIEKVLSKYGIRYLHMKELGGLRKPQKDSKNKIWRNQSFRGFADYMQTKEFRGAILKLERLCEKGNVCIMCAEGNPFRCHRALVSDAMIARGFEVFEIRKKSKMKRKLTPFAKVKSGTVIYG